MHLYQPYLPGKLEMLTKIYIRAYRIMHIPFAAISKYYLRQYLANAFLFKKNAKCAA